MERFVKAQEGVYATDLTAEDILGDVDAMKLRSSMTLFAQVGGEDSVFHRVLARFYNGKMDEHTLVLL